MLFPTTWSYPLLKCLVRGGNGRTWNWYIRITMHQYKYVPWCWRTLGSIFVQAYWKFILQLLKVCLICSFLRRRGFLWLFHPFTLHSYEVSSPAIWRVFDSSILSILTSFCVHWWWLWIIVFPVTFFPFVTFKLFHSTNPLGITGTYSQSCVGIFEYGRFLLQVTVHCFTNTESIPNTCKS